ncbi:DEAD-box ATP-dependent RNA helicase 7 [Zostera marina]|uniref:DEAD-box ATP-dependent RNA helicase 7 n=1 Tax=Zostera marina TaxID=29655 RepID=A0A0K9NV39_ZOSMR|nr:DEAD-box ATP-dependent RNA helicase 7 [Zostera marina]
MPSLTVDAAISPMDSSKKKMKKAALAAAELLEQATVGAHSPDIGESKPKKENKKSKRKRKGSDEEGEKSETSSENGSNLKKKKKVKIVKSEIEHVEKAEEVIVDDPNTLSNFRISQVLVDKLKSKGINALFPIQAMTYNIIVDGTDLVGRARTGQGKTLAFVLPILESLTNGLNKQARQKGYGRPPTVLVLLPTRELANQVHADFEFYGGAVGLSSCCVYGGSPYRTQEMAMRKGVDIVVGTPGRIKDHLQRGTLNFKSLKFRVLDEADEMLKMGFVDDVELILGKVEDASNVQTLLFSATLPIWVEKLSARFLKASKKIADLVGNEKMKASASVRHLALPCSHKARSQIIPDIIRCYSGEGTTIIFTETKESASALSGLLPGARALHGDVMQQQREVILAGFRSGRFKVLVATNVAARGLDINDVQLIIQCEPPRDVEAYIHRSGRTGRAGNTGVAVLLYDPKYQFAITKIERESGFKFERISAPKFDDVVESVVPQAAEAIVSVSDSVVPLFLPYVDKILNSSALSARELLAKALSKVSGYTDIKTRSLLSSMEDSVTLLLKVGTPIYTMSFAYGILRRFLSDDKVEAVTGLCLTADGQGAVFDVPSKDVDAFIQGQENAAGVSVEILKQLPALQEKDQSRGGGRYGGGGSRYGGGGRGGYNRFGGRGGGGRGGGGRFGRR